MKFLSIAACLAAALVLAGCKDDPAPISGTETQDLMASSTPAEPAAEPQSAPAQEALPATAIVITPLAPRFNETLTLQSATIPLSAGNPESPIVWLLNSAPVRPGVGSGLLLSLPEAMAKKGDSVQAMVTVRGTDILSNIIQVRNTPPDITYAKLMPETFGPGDSIYLDVKATDADGDPVEFRYEWNVNGSAAGNGKNIGSPLKRGDSFEVLATPFDGEETGEPVKIVRNATNMPPMLDNHRDFTFDGTTYTYQARATDADRDPLVYGLSSAPAGMSIDPASGLVTWQVPKEFTGTAAYVITVADGSGGSSQMQMSFTVTVEK